MNKKKRNDIILAVVVLCLAAAGLMLMNVLKKNGEYAVIKVDGVETERYSISENTEVVIKTGENDEYENVLVIENGKAFMKSANCPDKICVEHNEISFTGETIVCLPHKIVVEITGDSVENDLDAAV